MNRFTAAGLLVPSLLCATASAQPLNFAGRFDVLEGERIGAVATADLDGDGRREIVACDPSRARMVVLRPGAGRPEVASELLLDVLGDSVVAADLDGDGNVDVAIASAARSAVAVLRGRGDGSFEAPVWSDLPFAPSRVAAADFTGDGRTDLVATSSADQVALLPAVAQGGFGPPRTFRVEGRCVGAAAADFDGDGVADLAVALIDTSRVALLRGNGDLFDPPTSASVCWGVVQAIAVGDVDGDGNMDVVSANGAYEQPRGSFFDLSVFLGDGHGGIVRSQCLARTRENRGAIELADVNGDGKLDIVVSNPRSSSVSALMNESSGPGVVDFGTSIEIGAGGTPLGLAAADADGDGRADLLFATDHGLTVVPNRGSDGPYVPTSFRGGVSPSAIAAADVNGDGDLDLVTADPTVNTVTVLSGDGDARFRRTQTITVPRSPTYLATVDLNGDGVLDAITSNVDARSISILTGGSSTGLVLASSPTIPETPGTVGTMDVNRDRRLDVLVLGTSSLFVVRQLPVGGLDYATAMSLAGIGGGDLAVGDLDGDGLPDLIVTRPGAGLVTTILGAPTGFGAALDLPLPGQPGAIALGDLDGDGRLDAVVGDRQDGTATVLLGDGAGSFVAAGSTAFPASLTSLLLRDVDGDGRLDAVGSHFSVAIALGDGAGGLGRPLVFGGGGEPFGIACLDVDGDGDLDVVTANHAQDDVSVLWNASRPFVRSVLPRGGLAGTRVFVEGSRIAGGLVRFGGVPAASQTSRPDGSIVAVAPEGSGTVDVSVTTPEGEAVAPRAFTYLEPWIAARAGNVDGADGPPANVVTIDGDAGLGFERTVRLLAESAFRIEVAAAPGAESSPFVLYAWAVVPTPLSATSQALGADSLGTMVLPTPLSGGKPRAFRVWNNLPDGAAFGAPTGPSSPAPWTVFRHKPNRMRRGTATLQGFMADESSPNAIPLSITNAVILTLY